jgi:cobalt-zinc-cadmium efflux system outer membrane protein
LRLLLRFNALFVIIGIAGAQMPQANSPPSMISMDDAIRIALAYNQSLRAQRLNIDQNRADEVTAALKPNPTFTTLVDTIPLFSPQMIRLNTQIYSESLAYTYERGGKREKRLTVAKDNTDVSAKTVTDNERQLRFQVVQAFINVLLAKSVLQFAKEDLANFSQEVDLNHARLVAGDLGEGDYLKISLQKLQFEQDVSSGELSVVQAKATLRQLLGYQSVADDYDVTGALAHKKQVVQLADLE